MPGAVPDACLATSDAAVRTAAPVAEASRGSPGCDATPLPLDVIGLRMASLAVAAGGSGYAAGDTIMLPSYSAPWMQSDGIHAGPNSVAY